MRKAFYSFAALLTLAACSKEQNTVETPVTSNKATLEISLTPTKATISDSGTGEATFAWEEGDKVGVVVNGTIVPFELTEMTEEKAKFTGELPEGVKIEGGEEVAYPFVEEDTVEDGGLVIAFPDHYDIDKADEFRLRWKGVLEEDTDNGGFKTALEHTSGIFRVTYSAVPEQTKAVVLTQGEETVTLNLGEDFDLTPAEEGKGVSFYFPVQAGEKSGFTVALSDGTNVIAGTERTSTKNFTYEIGKIYRTPMITLNVYQKVTDPEVLTEGKYILVYPNGTTYRLFSFLQAMENAEVAGALAADTHGLENILKQGSLLYSTVVANNCIDVEGPENAESLILTPDQQNKASIDATLLDADHAWDLVDGKVVLSATTEAGNSYSIPVDHTVVKIEDGNADIVAAFNAPGIIAAVKSIRGTDLPVDFEYLINFAVSQAKKEGVEFTTEQVNRLKSGFEHLCALAKTLVANHPEVFGNGTLMDIYLSTNVFDVFSRYYDNATELSWAFAPEKRFGLATLGYHSYDKGFTFNVGMPQSGWFNRVDASLCYDADNDGVLEAEDCVAYWAQFDSQYDLPVENFFERASRRALKELDSSTLAMLQQMAADGKFTSIGKVYKKYVDRFNDSLEPVCIYKKAE